MNWLFITPRSPSRAHHSSHLLGSVKGLVIAQQDRESARHSFGSVFVVVVVVAVVSGGVTTLTPAGCLVGPGPSILM